MSRNVSKLPYDDTLDLIRNKIAKLYNGELDDVLTDLNYYDSLLRLVIADNNNERKISKKFIKDISKIDFDLENNETIGTIDVDGATVEVCRGGGDWQTPIMFAVYFDGNDVRGYVPEKGNLYNTDEKIALSEDDTDINDIKRYAKKNGIDLSNITSYDDISLSDEIRHNPLIVKAIRKRLKSI